MTIRIRIKVGHDEVRGLVWGWGHFHRGVDLIKDEGDNVDQDEHVESKCWKIRMGTSPYGVPKIKVTSYMMDNEDGDFSIGSAPNIKVTIWIRKRMDTFPYGVPQLHERIVSEATHSIVTLLSPSRT